MSFNSFGSSIKLNNVKTYNGVNTSATTSFKNAFYSDIEDIDYSKYEEIDYNSLDLEKGIEEAKEKANEQPWYKTIFDYTQTIRSSFNWGILEVVENIGDGLIMLGSASMAARASVVDSIFGTSYADKIKETASNMIAYDWTEAGYQAEMKSLGVSEEIANGMAHTIAGGIGTTAGYVAMSFIPGGAAVTATAGALSAVGSSSEMVFNSGATYEEALTVSMVAAVAGGVSGGALNKIRTAARGATSLLQVGVYATAGAGVSMLEPVVNTTAQYYTYGKDMVDENGNKLYDNWGDYYVESGGALNTAIAGVAGGFSTGFQAYKGYSEVKSYASNDNISKQQVKVAEKNYRRQSDSFTSRKDYYDTLDYVEKNSEYKVWDDSLGGYSGKDVRISDNDPGLTRCLTPEARAKWHQTALDYDVDGITRANVGTTNVDAFDRFVVGDGNYGNFGRPGDYNFACFGEFDRNGLINSANLNKNNVVNQFEINRGLETTNSDRLITYSYDVNSSSVGMHTGKELGSNSQRLVGGLPDGSTEFVHNTMPIDQGIAQNTKVSIMDNQNNLWFDGTLSDLATLKKNDYAAYTHILGLY